MQAKKHAILDTRKFRVSNKIKKALYLIVHNGYPVKNAAIEADMTERGLQLALSKQHVREYKKDIVHAFMASGTELARFTIVDLMKNSKSDAIKLDAAREILRLNGEYGIDNQKIDVGGITIVYHQKPPPNKIDNLVTIDAESHEIRDNE